MLVVRWIAGSHPQGDAKWIAGSSPAMTVLRKRIFINYSGHDIVRKKRKEQRESFGLMSTFERCRRPTNAKALAQCQQLFAEARASGEENGNEQQQNATHET